MFTTIVGLLVVGFFIWGFHKDGILDKLQHEKLKDLTVNDFVALVLGFTLVITFLKLLSDLF